MEIHCRHQAALLTNPAIMAITPGLKKSPAGNISVAGLAQRSVTLNPNLPQCDSQQRQGHANNSAGAHDQEEGKDWLVHRCLLEQMPDV